MLVTGVQAVGSKGVSAVQVAASDPKDATRAREAAGHEQSVDGAPRNGDSQPVVFPRAGLPLDQRPTGLRHQRAAARYRGDGGDGGDEQSHEEPAPKSRGRSVAV